MSEYDSLIEGYPGLDDPANDPGPLSDEEHQAMEEMMVTVESVEVVIESGEMTVKQDGVEASLEEVFDLEEILTEIELRALKSDQRPQVGKHYVIYGGKPMPVVRDSLTATEDEFVRDNLFVPTDLKDHDGQRQARADRTLRLRYRGYVCGEMTSL